MDKSLSAVLKIIGEERKEEFLSMLSLIIPESRSPFLHWMRSSKRKPYDYIPDNLWDYWVEYGNLRRAVQHHETIVLDIDSINIDTNVDTDENKFVIKIELKFDIK